MLPDFITESDVNFCVFMQATDRFGGFVLTSEIIKGIHSRFKKEGIEINYPMRNVVFPESNGHAQTPNILWPGTRRLS